MASTTKFVTDTVENVGSTQITITEDKLRNILLKHVPMIRKSRDWVGAFFTTASLSASIYACNFAAKLGLPADMWKGMFLVLIVISALLFLYSCFNAIHNNSNEEKIIKDIKNVEGISQVHDHCAYGIKFENSKITFFKEFISSNTKNTNSTTKE